MRISDWSSDVCSSDLRIDPRPESLAGATPDICIHRRTKAARQTGGGLADRCHAGGGDGIRQPIVRGGDRRMVDLDEAVVSHCPSPPRPVRQGWRRHRSEEHTSELQSLMRISYAVFCLKKKNNKQRNSISYTVDAY